MPTLSKLNQVFWLLLERGMLLIALVVSILGATSTFYWVFIDTAAPLRVVRSPTGAVLDRVINATVIAGGTLHIERNYCVDRQTVGKINRRIIDTVVFAYPSAESFTEVGCYERRVHTVDIPPLLPNGRYIYKVTATYDVNPLRTIVVELPEVAFEIVDPPLSTPARRR